MGKDKDTPEWAKTMMENIDRKLDMVRDAFDRRMTTVEDKLRSHDENLRTLAIDVETIKTENAQLLMVNSTIQKQNDDLIEHLNKLEFEHHRKFLYIYGLQDQKSENTDEVVTKYLRRALDVDVSVSATRIGKNRMIDGDGNLAPRPIEVEFQKLSDKNRVWNARKLCRGSPIRLGQRLSAQLENESRTLTPFFHAARNQ